MKYVTLSLLLLSLFGCSKSPKYKVGDCFIHDGKLQIVDKVGKYSYEHHSRYGWSISEIEHLDKTSSLNDCFGHIK